MCCCWKNKKWPVEQNAGKGLERSKKKTRLFFLRSVYGLKQFYSLVFMLWYLLISVMFEKTFGL